METELNNLNQTQNNNNNNNTQIDNGDQPLLQPNSPPSDQQQGSHSQPSDQQGSHQQTQQKSLTQQELQELDKKFAAFVRNDVYGPMGRGPIPFLEKLILGFAMITILPLRVVVGMSILVVYYLICKICTCFSRPDRPDDYAHLGGWRRGVIVGSGKFLSRALLFTLGFYSISTTSRVFDLQKEDNHNDESDSKDLLENAERPGVIISNHISYLDILYHMSSSFPSFVAKRSVGKLPLVGLISKCLGCVYVQREDKSSDFKGVSGIVTDRIKETRDNSDAPLMLIFPEGTTTNGNFLLPFKSGAFIAGAPVLPVILRYPYKRFSPAWDSISGVWHVVLLLCQFVNYMEVTSLPIYNPSKEEKDDPRLYANNVRKLMANEGNLILSDIGLPEKRIYHAALNGFLCQR